MRKFACAVKHEEHPRRELKKSNSTEIPPISAEIAKVKSMETKKFIRVMIVGDYLIFRNGLKLLFETEEQIKLVGETASLAETAEAIRRVKPDVLLINSTESEVFSAEFHLAQMLNVPIIVLTNSHTRECRKIISCSALAEWFPKVKLPTHFLPLIKE